ncbi:hypothetical protein H8B09_11330 [Paenibacillus sp. PR3]|uniref:Lipoprotein n=1 Tax=Paenibacillus terricola TaxID=2763503 RepID=A0ABR8MTR7_9BACL|nr:hypothetical protein [Paenibacillus terricola]MBD3919348.1 hypothetical protein [Paenibacillus terricola]
MRTLAFVLLTMTLLVGCSSIHTSQRPSVNENSEILNNNAYTKTSLQKERSAAQEDEIINLSWDYLSNSAKKTVINKNEAIVEKSTFEQIPIKLTKKNNYTEIYKVTFSTNQDELLGPIVIFIDSQTKEIIGKGARK